MNIFAGEFLWNCILCRIPESAMIKYIERGDIFAIPGVTSYAHGCNCVGAMGKGIAVQFRNKFPAMYEEYRQLCADGSYRVGDVFDYNYGSGHIYNLGTQASWRTQAKLEYIRSSVEKMLALAQADGVDRIALPAIGAGLGGLEWDEVKAVLDAAAAKNPEVDLYVVETYSPC
jgi:hypothetical protein